MSPEELHEAFYGELKPDKAKLEALAPYKDITGMDPVEELGHAFVLENYIEDVEAALWHERRRLGERFPSLEDMPEEGHFIENQAYDALDELAAGGNTFFVRQVAEGVVSSPVATIFDHRPGKGDHPVTPQQFWERFVEAPRTGPNLRAGWRDRVFDEYATPVLESCGKSLATLEADETYRHFRNRRNELGAQGRMWQVAYEMADDEYAAFREGKKLRMLAFGEVSSHKTDPAFYEQFVSQQKIDIDDILANDLSYVPVRLSSDAIGFCEESGRLVEAFSTTDTAETVDEQGYATPIDIEATVKARLHDYEDQQLRAAEIAFRHTTGNLQTRFIMERALSIDLADYSLDDQIVLSRLFVSCTDEQMDAVKSLLGKEDFDLVRAAAGAIEFGPDIADATLSIIERCPVRKSAEVIGIIGPYRDQSRQFANWFEAYDPDFAGAAERAMNERLTDTLAALETLAAEGNLKADLGPGGQFELSSVDEALEIMHLQQKTMRTIHDVITDPDVATSPVTAENGQFAMYRFASQAHGQALLYVRPEGAKGYDRRFEYGNRQGVEASISFIANPADSHAFLSEKDPDGVSIRFDREGRKKDESPFSEDRDPTRKDGSISLDISSILGKSDSPAVRIGKLVAAGNVIRSAKHGGFESLHHNNNHFDQDTYGDAEGFSKLAIYIMHLAEAQIAVQRQGRHHSRFGKLAVTGGQEGAKAA